MNNFILTLNVISPLFFLLAFGYLLKVIKVIDEKLIDGMNTLCFKAFFLILMFYNIYNTDIKNTFNMKLVLFAVVIVLLIFILLVLTIPFIEKDKAKIGALIQGIFRSNFIIFGLPISIALCGKENTGPTAILIAIIVPLYNALSVIVLEFCRGEKIKISNVIKGILTNPLVIGGIAGALTLLLNIKLPTALNAAIGDVAKLTTPISLIFLGASFKFLETKKNLRNIIIAVLAKIVIIPAIFIPISMLMGFRNVELVSLVAMLAAPTAVSTYAMASKMDSDSLLAGQIVVFDSIGSIFTMFFWIFTLKQLGFF